MQSLRIEDKGTSLKTKSQMRTLSRQKIKKNLSSIPWAQSGEYRVNTKFPLCYDIIVLILVAIGNYIVSPNALLPCKPKMGDMFALCYA